MALKFDFIFLKTFVQLEFYCIYQSLSFQGGSKPNYPASNGQPRTSRTLPFQVLCQTDPHRYFLDPIQNRFLSPESLEGMLCS
jgi:hypothetical protein